MINRYMNKTSVVDIHKKKKGIRPEFDEYIGRRITRQNKSTIDLKKYWKKGSKWQNPYNTVEEYEPYIRKKIKQNPTYYNIKELIGKKLGDWCITTNKIEPLVCHGQIILKIIKEVYKNGE